MSQRVFRRVCFLLALLGAFGVVAAEESPVAGTLPEDYIPALQPILQTALQRSPQIFAAELDLELEQARLYRERAPMLPSLGAGIDFASSQTAISRNTSMRTRDNGLFYRIEARQALFHWGALKNQAAAGRISVLVAEKKYAEARRELAVLLRQSYLELVVAKARLRHVREQFRLSEERLTQLREDQKHGKAPPAAVGMREIELREEKLRLDRIETTFAADLRRFARIAGLKELPEEQIADEIPKPAFSAETTAGLAAALLRDGAKSSFEAEIHTLKIREANLRYRVERVRLLPKFFAAAGHSVENTTFATPSSVDQQGVVRQTVSVNTQWTVFDGLASRGYKLEALANKRYHERQLAAVTEELLERAQMLERQLKLDAEEVELTGIRYSLALEARKDAARESELGKAPPTMVEQAQASVYAAQATNLLARATFLGRWSEFVSLAVGDPLLNPPLDRHAR